MSNERSWEELLSRVELEGQCHPVSEEILKSFEREQGIQLPASYRRFCKVFGPGRLNGAIGIQIAAPTGHEPTAASADSSAEASVEALNKDIWDTRFIDLDEYCSDPSLVRSGLFFGSDIYTHHYFWNKHEVTDQASNEMAVYVIYREWSIHRLAATFESFVFDVCLEKGIPDHGVLDYDPPLFEPGPHP